MKIRCATLDDAVRLVNHVKKLMDKGYALWSYSTHMTGAASDPVVVEVGGVSGLLHDLVPDSGVRVV